MLLTKIVFHEKPTRGFLKDFRDVDFLYQMCDDEVIEKMMFIEMFDNDISKVKLITLSRPNGNLEILEIKGSYPTYRRNVNEFLAQLRDKLGYKEILINVDDSRMRNYGSKINWLPYENDYLKLGD